LPPDPSSHSLSTNANAAERIRQREASSRFGRYFEEFRVGDVYRHWPGRTITEADNALFCMLTGNHHPVHIDAHYAEHAHHGQRLVVGTLVLSVVVGMSVPDVSGKAVANLEYSEVKHTGPTFCGDTLYAESTVLSVRESRSNPGRGVVEVETRAYNQRDELVLSLRRKVLVPKRPALPAEGDGR